MSKEDLTELSNALKARYRYNAGLEIAGKEQRIKNNLRSMRSDSMKLSSLLPNSNWNKKRKDNVKTAAEIEKRHKGIRKSKGLK